MLKVGLIVGSTRPNRFADIPVPWLVEGASARRDLQLTVLDLRDFQLPFLNEPASPMATGGVFTEPAAQAWCKSISEFDDFLAMFADNNQQPPAALKNASHHAALDWYPNHLPFTLSHRRHSA